MEYIYNIEDIIAFMLNSKDLLSKVDEHLKKSSDSYTTIRLIVAKNIFIFIAVLYYSVWLFTVWGWYKDMMSRATFFLFILLTASVFWLLACLAEYVLYIYKPQLIKLIYGVWVIFLLLFFGVLSLHFELIHF